MKNKYNIPVVNHKLTNARPNEMIWHDLNHTKNTIRYDRNCRENENIDYKEFGFVIIKYLKQ